MIFSLTTTPKTVLEPQDYDRVLQFSAGKYVTAVTVYVRPANTLNPWILLNAAGRSDQIMDIPHGTTLEAYTDAGTAELSVIKTGP